MRHKECFWKTFLVSMESEETLRFNLTLAYNTILKVAPIKANKTHIQRALSVPPYEKWELRVEKHLGRANKAEGRISHRHSASLFLSLSHPEMTPTNCC